MDDYISRESASDLLVMALIDDWEPEYAQDRINEIHAADVRPVVKGHWERTLWFVTCSVCEYTSADTDDEGSKIALNFCPNCGADMRGANLDATKGDSHD